MLTAAQILDASATPATPVPSRWEQRVTWAARELCFDAPPSAAELQARFVERLADEQFMPQGSASEAFRTLMADAEGIIEVDDPPPFAHAQHFSLLTRLEALQGELLSLPVGVRRERLARLKAECAHDPWPSARVGLLERHLQVDVETTTRSDEPLRELIAGLIELTTLRPLPRAVRRRELVRSLQRHGNTAGLSQRLSKLRPDVAQLDPWLLVLLEKLPAEVPGELATKSSVAMGSYNATQVHSSYAMATAPGVTWKEARRTWGQWGATFIGLLFLAVFVIGLCFVAYQGIVEPQRRRQREQFAAEEAARTAAQRELLRQQEREMDRVARENMATSSAPRSLDETRQNSSGRAVEAAQSLVQQFQERLEQERPKEADRKRQSERDIFGTRPRGVDINPLDNGTQRILEDSRRRIEESRQRSDQMMRDFEQRRKEREEKYEAQRKQRDEEFRQQQEETYKRLGIPPPRLPY